MYIWIDCTRTIEASCEAKPGFETKLNSLSVLIVIRRIGGNSFHEDLPLGHHGYFHFFPDRGFKKTRFRNKKVLACQEICFFRALGFLGACSVHVVAKSGCYFVQGLVSTLHVATLVALYSGNLGLNELEGFSPLLQQPTCCASFDLVVNLIFSGFLLHFTWFIEKQAVPSPLSMKSSRWVVCCLERMRLRRTSLLI